MPPANHIRVIRVANKLALIDTPDPVHVPLTVVGIKASVVSNIEARLRYLACLTPEQFEAKVRGIAADLVAAVLVLSKEQR